VGRATSRAMFTVVLEIKTRLRQLFDVKDFETIGFGLPDTFIKSYVHKFMETSQNESLGRS